jgi:predicted secreted Zn-dependent protease
MDTKRPTNRNGERFDASAEWKVTWRAEYTSNDAGCRVRKATVSVYVTVSVPNLAASAPGEVRLRFDRYYAGLLEHEKDHVETGIQVGREISSGLVTLPPEATCEALEEVIQLFANGVVAKGNERDIAIDRETSYGATQGAVFP